jgi:hypothetical protein
METETHEAAPVTCLGVSLANVLIFSRTTEIPLSSEAFNSNTLARNRSGLSKYGQRSVSSEVTGHSREDGMDVPKHLSC